MVLAQQVISSSSMSNRLADPNRVTLTFGALVASLLLAWAVTPPMPWLDDAYIALHSAQVWRSGHDATYGAPALAGSTSPPHVLMIVGALALGLAPITALRLVTILGAASVALLLGLYVQQQTAIPLVRRVALFGIAAAHLWFQSVNGLETGLCLAVTLACFITAPKRPLVTAALAGLLPALRPDLAVTAAAIWVATAWSQSWARRGQMACLFVVVGLPWIALNYAETGHWLPATANVKRTFFAQACAPFGVKADAAAWSLGLYLLSAIPCSVGLVGLRRGIGWLGMAAIAITSTAYLLELPLGLQYNNFRYTTAIVGPWLVWGLCELATRRPASELVTAIWIAGLVVALPLAQRPNLDGAQEIQDATTWLDQHTPESALIAVQDAGAIAVFGHRSAVEIVGLKSDISARVHQRVTFPTCGAARQRPCERSSNTPGRRILW
jgi:hypothetical protein